MGKKFPVWCFISWGAVALGGGGGPLGFCFLRWFGGEKHQQQRNNDDNYIQRFAV